MAKEWFYTRDGRNRTGPVAGLELRNLAARGEIRPSDLIWKEGMPRFHLCHDFSLHQSPDLGDVTFPMIPFIAKVRPSEVDL